MPCEVTPGSKYSTGVEITRRTVRKVARKGLISCKPRSGSLRMAATRKPLPSKLPRPPSAKRVRELERQMQGVWLKLLQLEGDLCRLSQLIHTNLLPLSRPESSSPAPLNRRVHRILSGTYPH